MQISTDTFEEDNKDSIIQNLKDQAMNEPCCGQTAMVDRKAILVPKSEQIAYALVTNVIEYQSSSEAPSLSNDSLKRLNEGMLESGMSWKRTKARRHNSRRRR